MAVPETMRAVGIDSYGGPEIVHHRTIPVPRPAPGEVLVRLAWSGINFMDIHTRQGKYKTSQTYRVRAPTTLGMEGAGVVAAIGDGVQDIAVGARVAYCLAWGSYAEFAAVPADKIVPVPDAMPLRAAASLLFHGLTAHYLVHDIGRLAPGVSALVLSASGGIGQLLVQLGTALGGTIYAVTSSAEKAEVAKRRGATEAILYREGAYADDVRELTGGQGVDVVFDPVGAPTFRHSLRAARTKGLIVSFGSVGGSIKDIDPIELGEAGSLFLTRPRLADHIADALTLRWRAAEIFARYLDGRLAFEVSSIYELDGVRDAHQKLEGRASVGKPLLRIAGDLD